MSVDGAANAGLLAVRVLASAPDPAGRHLAAELAAYADDLKASVLAKDAVLRIAAADQRAHRPLGGAVGRRHRVEALRALVLGAAAGAEVRQDGRRRRVGQLVGEVQVLVEVGGIDGHDDPRRCAARRRITAYYREPASAR